MVRGTAKRFLDFPRLRAVSTVERGLAVLAIAAIFAHFPLAYCDAGERSGSGAGHPLVGGGGDAQSDIGTPALAQTPAVSIDEARKITSAAESGNSASPPRTISDITAVLDQEKPDATRLAGEKIKADTAPPAGLEGAESARFYAERGAAASAIGRADQSVADFAEAVQIIRPLRSDYPEKYNEYINFLASAQQKFGHPRIALKLHEEAITFAESMPNMRGAVFSHYYHLTELNVRLGDMTAANSWLEKGEATLARVPSWKGPRAQTRINLFKGQVDWSRATFLQGQGKFAEAEPYYRRAVAEETAVIEDSKHWDVQYPAGLFETGRDFVTRDLALNLAQQGRFVEGEIEVRKALLDQLHLRGRYSQETAFLIEVLGFIIAQQGRYSEAERLQRVAIDTLVHAGHVPNSISLNAAQRNLADVLVIEQRWTDALAQYDAMEQALSKDPQSLHRLIGGDLNYANALVEGKRYDAALEVAARAVQYRTKALGEKHYNTAEAHGFHALALAATGNEKDALSEFGLAVPILLQGSRQIIEDESGGTGQEVRFHRILERYLGVLADQHGDAARESFAEAFRIADAARGRAVQRALTASAARSAVGDPALADLVRREQDAERQVVTLNATISDIIELPSDQQDSKAVEALRGQIDQLRAARATIRAEIEKRFPDYVNLIDPKPATIAQAQAALEPGEALLATYTAKERTYVWAVPKEGPAAFATVALTRSELEAVVGELRKSLDPNASTLGEIPTFNVALAYKLFALLLKPVEAGWKGAKSVLVVAHGALAQLPLGLLVTTPTSLEPERDGQTPFSRYKKVPWLIRDVAIDELPSVASLTALRSSQTSTAGAKPFIGFGDPWFNAKEAAQGEAGAGGTQMAALQSRGGSGKLAARGVPLHLRSVPKTETVNSAELALLPRLPETAEEVRQVAIALKADPKSDVILGARANEHIVRTMKLDDRRVVMFATHGLIPGDLDGLTEPALALSSPEVAGSGGDGLLTTSKILDLKLNAEWVVLSACNTAAGNGAGAEAVSGLGLAFFYAGTRAVLVSNWPVETTSARALTTALFHHEAESPGISRAEALRQSMLELIDSPGFADPSQERPLFSYAHPIFWAPFSLVGDGGRGRGA